MSETKKAEKKEKKTKKKLTSLWSEFKQFISRGNALDMAVGVVIGGAFSAIVTALVNILLSLCTWGIPGGINGLITILPAANSAQEGLDPTIGLTQNFAKGDLDKLAQALAEASAKVTGIEVDSAAISNAKSTITSNYTLYGTTYAYNQSAVINWGAFINAIITFIIIAATLFIIIKVVKYLGKKRKELEAKALEQYYLKHPEERPVPPTPGKPAPTELSVLTEIKDQLIQLNKNQEKPIDSEKLDQK